MSLFTCRQVSMAYEGRTVLSGIDFSVNTGDYLGIIGENGAGKSTLIKGLLGMKKISGGEMITDSGLSPRDIGYLPQQTPVQKDFPACVWEVVLSGRLNRCGMYPFYRKRDKEDALEKMDLLGITPLKNRCYRDLSGGQQQRVLLARALCAAGKLLFWTSLSQALTLPLPATCIKYSETALKNTASRLSWCPTMWKGHSEKRTGFSIWPTADSSFTGAKKTT